MTERSFTQTRSARGGIFDLRCSRELFPIPLPLLSMAEICQCEVKHAWYVYHSHIISTITLTEFVLLYWPQRIAYFKIIVVKYHLKWLRITQQSITFSHFAVLEIYHLCVISQLIGLTKKLLMHSQSFYVQTDLQW